MKIGFEVDEAYENEFAQKCEVLQMYGSIAPRTTLDGEWTEEELAGDIVDECIKLLPEYEKKYAHKAVYNENLYKPEYMAESIKIEAGDLIEVYNREYDRHRNDSKFGIYWYDEWVRQQIKRRMKSNLVGGK